MNYQNTNNTKHLTIQEPMYREGKNITITETKEVKTS